MIEKCPECDGEIDVLPIQSPEIESVTSTVQNLTFTGSTTGQSYAPTSKMYKCSNPKCWVTKIKESWE